ncbi:hypothetical protein shim_18030 [Shimia sp. SK013]|uniref:DUF4153 domain-containing protein n=1 Tax=Shimia sp. SK013 TaxID=1389006 RepID=UPI0006B46CA6|nr:DUF4153 domain-containing protein [Shimia sp. SK013]KPA21918.1 hypothetical protein shim_18030 [Shimia sp. SK013]
MYSEDGRTMAGRVEMAIVGAAAGLAMWALVDKGRDIVTNPHAYLATVSFAAGFFAILLGLSGPHRVARAALPALLLGGIGALLITLSGLRFGTLDEIGQAGHPIAGWALFLCIATPFAAVRLVQHESLTDYGRLFDTSWSILVRYSAGWLFSGIFFGVAFLSHALLDIVGITIIEDLLEHEPVLWAFVGFSLGLGLSVVHELRQYLSPYLLLRMLRMLVPVVLVVVAVFAAAALFQGPDQLFGSLSRAATLLAVALVMISLITIALDRSDADAFEPRWMQLSTAALAMLLPVIAALATYAIWLRVAQYGWTPTRLLSAAVAFVIVLHAVAYLVCVVMGAGWMARVRRANVWIAGATLVSIAAWMSPVLNAERISTSNQMARAESGAVRPDQAPLWEMQHEWGKAGRDGLEALKVSENVALAKAAEEVSKGRRPGREDQRAEMVQQLLEVLVVLPAGEQITADQIGNMSSWELAEFEDCGEDPENRCVLVFGDFGATVEGRQAILLQSEPGRSSWRRWMVTFDSNSVDFQRLASRYSLTKAHIQRLVDGDYRVAPSSLNSLWIGDFEILPTE